MQTIVAMGFTPEQATKALKNTENNVERAMDWIFSHADDMETEETASTAAPKFKDGESSKSFFVSNY